MLTFSQYSCERVTNALSTSEFSFLTFATWLRSKMKPFSSTHLCLG